MTNRKKTIYIIVGILLAAALAVIFWDPILDALPIDQSGWRQRDENVFYMDEDGDPLTGWQEIEGNRYYFGTDGIRRYGWQEVEGNTYYFSAEGSMASGWVTVEDQTYYLHADGARATGAAQIDGKTHYFTDEGIPLTGWQEIGGSRCYLDDLGAALTGWQEIDGSRYHFTAQGSMDTCWLQEDGQHYYLGSDGRMVTGWVETDLGRSYFGTDGAALSGWQTIDANRYYLTEKGCPITGWQEIEGNRFFFHEDGTAATGWLELDGVKYYLTDTGIARGKLVIDGKSFFFTSTGANIIVVNPWNHVPEDYTVDLVAVPGGRVDKSCYDALMAMLNDCWKAGGAPCLASSYRTHADQVGLHNNMIANYMSDGYSYEAAYIEASTIVAIPGTSEHQLGLAVDIVDSEYTKLDYGQVLTYTQQWLMAHCWEYGFILRFPDGTTAKTGIIYEPWHYRYVGTELSMELKELGICLEEYLEKLTVE